MPCAVSKSEAEYWERIDNEERFGCKELTQRIIETVACELAHKLTEEQLKSLSPLAQKWIHYHDWQDKKRKKD